MVCSGLLERSGAIIVSDSSISLRSAQNDNGEFMSEKVIGFPPYFDGESRVLILGSFPSVKSRQQSFYYGHPQNAFWRILSTFFKEDKPLTVEERKAFCKRNKIALWDIVTECEIVGSRDETIKNFKVANLQEVLQNSSVSCILVNGGRAFSIFEKHYGGLEIPYFKLSSTSPANARRDDDEWYDALRLAFPLRGEGGCEADG